MTIEHFVETALIVVPTLITISIFTYFKRKNGVLPSEKSGGFIVYHSFEGITSVALLMSVAFSPELVAKVGEFRGMLGVLASRAAWGAFKTISAEINK